MKLLLVSSGGGHLVQLWWLRAWWGRHERVWVCLDTPDARERLADERVIWAHGPTNRHLPNLARNARLARRVLHRERPDALVSTGAGVAVPFFWAARLHGVPSAYLEVYDRIDAPSLSARLVAPVADRMLVQWPEQARFFAGAVHVGPVR